MGIFGHVSKKRVQQLREQYLQDQARKLEAARAAAQQVISLQEGMTEDSKCQALMREVEDLVQANKDGLLSVACNPPPIKAENMAIFLYMERQDAQPWDLDRDKTVKIGYAPHGLSLLGVNEAAFMYWLLQRCPFLAYKDYRGVSRDMEDVLAHCLNFPVDRTLAILYNTEKR